MSAIGHMMVVGEARSAMPDGDKFYWGVKGKGSRTLLSLLRAGAGFEVVADQGAKVVTEQLKKPVMRGVVEGSLKILDSALPRVETDASVPVRSEEDVRRSFRQLRSEAIGDDFATVAHRKAEETYERLRASGRSFSRADLKKELGMACTTAVLKYAVLDEKRFGLMEETGRLAQDQLALERSLVTGVASRMARNLDRVFDGRGDESLRAPRRRSIPREFTLEELHVPLAPQLR